MRGQPLSGPNMRKSREQHIMSPGHLRHGAHGAGLEGVDNGVESLHAHTGQVQHRADHRHVL